MPVRIEKISIKDCGPLKDFNEELSDLNLIYSENEKGKSYLVEFIIQSLFRKNTWKDLREQGRGKILVSGIENSKVEFSSARRTSKNKKLEDYLENQRKGLPACLSNLLIVKEGETEIIKDYGIDKDTFKEILSPRRVLNEIDNKISSTLKKAKIEDGEIIIEKKGEGSSYYDLNDKVGKIEALISQIVREYEQGEIKDLEIKKEQLLKVKNLLIKAKRYEAYRLSEELKELRKKQEKIPEIKIRELKDLIDKYSKYKEEFENLRSALESIKNKTEKLPELLEERDKLLKAKRYKAYKISKDISKIEEQLSKIRQEELAKIEKNIALYSEKYLEKEEKEKLLQQLRQKAKDYEWLKSASNLYEKFLTTPLNTENKFSFIPYVVALSLLISLLLFSMEFKTGGSILILLSTVAILFYSVKIKNLLRDYKKGKELESLQKEFSKRFNEALENLSQIVEKLNEQEKSFHSIAPYENEILRLTLELDSLRKEIANSFSRMGVSEIKEIQWREEYEKLKRERDSLLAQLQILRNELEKLDVQEEDYEAKDPGIKFDKERLEEINYEISDLKKLQTEEKEKEEKLSIVKKKLEEHKQRIKEIFKEIFGFDSGESEWQIKLQEMEMEKRNLESEIKEKEGRLKGLGVHERDFEKEDPQKAFSPEELDNIERQLEEIEKNIGQKRDELAGLRNKIIQLTGADASFNWNEIIEDTYQKKMEYAKSFEDLEAAIIGAILVHETIEELQQQEDEKLIEKINSSEIKNLVKKLTGRYDTLSFDGKDIIVSDDVDSFKLKELSTGAKEQVMIALRIGFARSLLKGQPAFLVFDDAFQHSDYKKRPLLIETLFELARDGWQIIYLTMDDHIRELFRAQSQNCPVGFKEICL